MNIYSAIAVLKNDEQRKVAQLLYVSTVCQSNRQCSRVCPYALATENKSYNSRVTHTSLSLLHDKTSEMIGRRVLQISRLSSGLKIAASRSKYTLVLVR